MCLFFLSFDCVYTFSLETREWMIFVINLHANICMDIYFVSVSFNAASFASWFNFSIRFQIDIYVISRYSLINYIVEFINWSNYQLKIRVLRNQMILFEKKDTFMYANIDKIKSIRYCKITLVLMHCWYRWICVTSLIHTIKNDKRGTILYGRCVFTVISQYNAWAEKS